MSWIHVRLTQATRTGAPGGPGLPPVLSYEVSAEVTGASGITSSLFVYDVSDDTFSHVATLQDVLSLPESKADARDLGFSFYRRPTMTAAYAAKSVAAAAAQQTAIRLQRVNKDWQAQEPGTFDAVSEVTYDSGDA